MCGDTGKRTIKIDKQMEEYIMTRNRKYIVKTTSLTEDIVFSESFGWNIEATSNSNARIAIKRQMKSEFGMIEGRDYTINSIKLDDTTNTQLKVKNTSKMSQKDAEDILGNRARWEVLNMKKALSSMQILNSPEENERLEACKIWLKHHK